MFGAIIGDIVGSVYEFNNIKTKNFSLFKERCSYTDDTVMTIAVAQALLKAREQKRDFKEILVQEMQDFGKRYPGRGYGCGFASWLDSNDPKPYNSYGNGSAMRVSYIADLVQDADNVLNLAGHSAKCTHGSESGILGACVTAAVIAMAKLQYSKEGIKEWVVEHTSYDISLPIEMLKHKYVWSETCDGTVPAAIRCFLDSTDYESCIRNCLSLPCDMDTMCCIAGGMAEAFYGTTGLDNETILKKYLTPHLYECIKDIVEKN